MRVDGHGPLSYRDLELIVAWWCTGVERDRGRNVGLFAGIELGEEGRLAKWKSGCPFQSRRTEAYAAQLQLGIRLVDERNGSGQPSGRPSEGESRICGASEL